MPIKVLKPVILINKKTTAKVAFYICIDLY